MSHHGWKTGLVVVCIAVFGNLIAADEYTVASDLGTSALGIGIGRVAGFSETADVIFENPAGLRQLKTSGFCVFSSQVIEAGYRSVSLALKLGNDAVALGYYGTNLGGIIGTTKFRIH